MSDRSYHHYHKKGGRTELLYFDFVVIVVTLQGQFGLRNTVDFFPQLNADHGGMEPEEHGQRQGYPLNDDPWHESVEAGFHQTGSDFLDFKGENQPLRYVEQKEENRDLATWSFVNHSFRHLLQQGVVFGSKQGFLKAKPFKKMDKILIKK